MRSRLAGLVAITAIMVSGCGSAGSPTPAGTTSEPSPTPGFGASPSATAAPATATPGATPGPTPTSAPEATMPATWASFSSTTHRYKVQYPADWTGTPAAQEWPADGFSFPDDPAVDKWARPGTNPSWVLFIVATQQLKPGETEDQRIARLDADNATVCQLSNRRAITVDGVAARREDGECFGSDFISEVAVIHNERSYLIYALSGGPLSATTLATFDRFLKSFQFS